MALADRDPGLPIKLTPASNGEFVPRPVSPAVREAIRRARERCAVTADRLGMPRRRFLLSSMGAATTLLALGACSRESGESHGGGSFDIPDIATTEPDAADEAIGDTGDPIIDVQTHLLEHDLSTPSSRFFGQGFPQAGCGEDDPRACFSTEHWLEEVFVRSDTTVAVLSAVPVLGDPDPLSAEVMARGLAAAEELCGESRALMQGHAVPNVGALDEALAAMDGLVERFPIAAWKTYTHVGTQPFRFTDELGDAFLAHVEDLGPPIVSVHKGFSGYSPFGSPDDIGPAAVAHPDLDFVVYHSGYEGDVEGPFDDATRRRGINRLIASVESAGLGPGSNVYAELGSTWRSLMAAPDQAAHVLGKLLAALGPDNVIWGTDSVWYGSPQDQIQAFRAFEITPEFQERHGYPELTAEIKAKILGQNAARLYGLDPATLPCRPDAAEVEGLRQESALDNRTYGPTSGAEARRVFAADHPWAVTRG